LERGRGSGSRSGTVELQYTRSTSSGSSSSSSSSIVHRISLSKACEAVQGDIRRRFRFLPRLHLVILLGQGVIRPSGSTRAAIVVAAAGTSSPSTSSIVHRLSVSLISIVTRYVPCTSSTRRTNSTTGSGSIVHRCIDNTDNSFRHDSGVWRSGGFTVPVPSLDVAAQVEFERNC
jgi:hypothetical protein